jgi:hypothetical protein
MTTIGFLPVGVQLVGNIAEHVFKSPGFAYVAVVELAVPDKPQTVDRQRKAYELTARLFLLGTAKVCFLAADHLSRKMHVGKVIDNYFAPARKQAAQLAVQPFFYSVLVFVHCLCGTIKPVPANILLCGVQLPGTGIFLQPSFRPPVRSTGTTACRSRAFVRCPLECHGGRPL